MAFRWGVTTGSRATLRPGALNGAGFSIARATPQVEAHAQANPRVGPPHIPSPPAGVDRDGEDFLRRLRQAGL